MRCNRSTPGKECVQECGNGFYFSQSKKECEPCSGNCTSCAGTADTCSSCVVDLALHGTKCLDKCPDGYFINLKTMSCERCSAKCATCFDGWTNDTCSSCNKPYFLRKWGCSGVEMQRSNSRWGRRKKYRKGRKYISYVSGVYSALI